MKNLLQISKSTLILAILTISCVKPSLISVNRLTSGEQTVVKESTEEVSKDFYKEILKNLDYRFFHNTMSDVKLPDNIKDKININDKIVICSADKTGNDYSDLQYIVENSLKMQCLNLNYFILERDYISVKRIVSEKNRDLNSITPSANFNSLLTSFKPMFSMIKPLLDTTSYSKFNFKPLFSSLENISSVPLQENTANILFADKLLTYRILEAGIKKANITNSNNLIRVAGAIIELNLIEVATSRLLASQIVEHFYSDEILQKTNTIVESFRMENTNYPFPLLMGFSRSHDMQLQSGKTATQINVPGKLSKMQFNIISGDFNSFAEITDEKGNHIFGIYIRKGIGGKYYEWSCADEYGNKVKEGKYFITLKSKDRSVNYSSPKEFYVNY